MPVGPVVVLETLLDPVPGRRVGEEGPGGAGGVTPVECEGWETLEEEDTETGSEGPHAHTELGDR